MYPRQSSDVLTAPTRRKGFKKSILDLESLVSGHEPKAKRLIDRIYTVRFQYIAAISSCLYLGVSLLAYGIGASSYLNEEESSYEYAVYMGIKSVKFAFSLVFLVEVTLRMVITGLTLYWFSLWNMADFLVVLLCALFDGMFMLYPNNHTLSYDGYFIAFRLWYTLRTTQIIYGIYEQKESEILNYSIGSLSKNAHNLIIQRENNNQMEIDLRLINKLIDSITRQQNERKAQDMAAIGSSWLNLVPLNAAITLKTPVIKKVILRSKTESNLNADPSLRPYNCRNTKRSYGKQTATNPYHPPQEESILSQPSPKIETSTKFSSSENSFKSFNQEVIIELEPQQEIFQIEPTHIEIKSTNELNNLGLQLETDNSMEIQTTPPVVSLLEIPWSRYNYVYEENIELEFLQRLSGFEYQSSQPSYEYYSERQDTDSGSPEIFGSPKSSSFETTE